MKIYPVMIPTLNRFEHLKRCVESLSANIHADKTELVIGLDYPPSEKYEYGYLKIKEYLPTIRGFGKITVFEHKENQGAIKNWQFCEKYCLENYDAYIATEDDNEFSPCFLDFMNKSLELYRDDSKVQSICGFSQSFYNKKDIPFVFCTYDNSAWGVGFWKHKLSVYKSLNNPADVVNSWKKSFKIFTYLPAPMYMLLTMVRKNRRYGDTMFTINNVLNDTFQIRPKVSLVRNWGNDGTGVNCTKNLKYFQKQYISSELYFGNVKTQTILLPSIKRLQFFVGLSNNKLVAYLSAFARLCVYILYRFRIIH